MLVTFGLISNLTARMLVPPSISMLSMDGLSRLSFSSVFCSVFILFDG